MNVINLPSLISTDLKINSPGLSYDTVTMKTLRVGSHTVISCMLPKPHQPVVANGQRILQEFSPFYWQNHWPPQVVVILATCSSPPHRTLS
ncbi:hypothetical protein GDO78_006142 [Eleutherodactylus coqui]|uniref:Uncharacterized protein n=1 Tax=Eleutherodactylus coqui TaxID=57060 RepID=A0A8J6FNM6_ELECQ|nr:hypothetical protein GDO78_006142 [Eleutherodactylus coqui]